MGLRAALLAVALIVAFWRRGLNDKRGLILPVLQCTGVTMLTVELVRIVAGLFLLLLPLPFMGLVALGLSLTAGYVALNGSASRSFDLNFEYAHELTMEVSIPTILLWIIAGAVMMALAPQPG